ncbi:G-type lectin S-receptor-like serine/threonine-protein kinase At4g27290 [Daucus carota subsp. sativus]|uniref:G-type lectin S-receptor-like serine/threonine-protein kinase At4g27290 n=1 Tax=Daucus carota subsp. sativus TaxID=79200 RepID=UPI003082EAC4
MWLSKTMNSTTMILLFCSTLSSILMNSVAVDTIRANQTMSDGRQVIVDGDTITSADGEFELGFFSPGRSTKRYLGIWYKKKSNGTVVWVANRDAPVTNTLGVVRVDTMGIILQTVDGIIWSTNISVSVKNPVAQLLDSGNLVLRDDHNINKDGFIWQSFDYPGNNLLPGMKLGLDLVAGLDRYTTSWKSDDDPSTGSFIHRLVPSGFPQFFVFKGSDTWSRTGPWNGHEFSGSSDNNPNGMYTENFVINKREVYYQFDTVHNTADIRFTLTPTGERRILVWNYENQIWMIYFTQVVNNCDRYAFCGAYGICNDLLRCECLRGFVPKFPMVWEASDWSGGCIRKNLQDCSTDGFVKYTGVKLPDTQHSWYDMRISLHECGRVCLQNCSCSAYANADTRSGGSGCILWFSDLIDFVGYKEHGQDIYVRMPASEIGEWDGRRSRGQRHIWIPGVLVVMILAPIFFCLSRKLKKRREENLRLTSEGIALNKIQSEDWELPLVDFKRIVHATDNFSRDNKLGEGGYGPVYKGIFSDGQEIAVKRLSKNSGQGLDEFINEVSCIAKLQHRNLVTLLGCCTEKGERILIYEYMANKSLDSFIFDEKVRKSMDWLRRYNIINGIARGLLYLHQDSKLRIIHRDLKASNILLDNEMNPKISDFGMARRFSGSQTEANTSRIVGTYGYMSPEYAGDGQFSVKSDVYSFGVLLIEIVSGIKNRLFSHSDHSLNLLGHAWKCYNEDRLVELIDELILESSKQMEVFRVILIGLLCVQEDPIDRPVMSEVVQMLSSNTTLPHPKKPGFFIERRLHETEHLLSNPNFSSGNQMTVTSIVPRE